MAPPKWHRLPLLEIRNWMVFDFYELTKANDCQMEIVGRVISFTRRSRSITTVVEDEAAVAVYVAVEATITMCRQWTIRMMIYASASVITDHRHHINIIILHQIIQ